MTEKRTNCTKCAAPLQQPRTGRPLVYCGPVCRQTAAYEIKRLQRRLEPLERDLTRERHGPNYYGSAKAQEKAIAQLEAEIAEVEGRLRVLVAGEASFSDNQESAC